MNTTKTPFLNPEIHTPEIDVEYLVITDDECFYTAFWCPLGMKGWVDVGTNRKLNVIAYQELPNANAALLSVYKTEKALQKAIDKF